MEHHGLIDQGLVDSFSGTESYAFRYYQGQLFANDVISLSNVNGSEGLFQTIIDKIKQFCAWIAKKIKGLFSSKPYFTFKSNGSVLACFHPSPKHNELDSYEFKQEAWKLKVAKHREIFNARISRLNAFADQNASLVAEFKKLQDVPSIVLSGVSNIDDGVYKHALERYIHNTKSMLDRLDGLTTAKQVSSACKDILYPNFQEYLKLQETLVTFKEFFLYRNEGSYAEVDLKKAMENVLGKIADEKDQNRVAVVLTRMVNMNTSYRENPCDVSMDIALAVFNDYYWTKKK